MSRFRAIVLGGLLAAVTVLGAAPAASAAPLATGIEWSGIYGTLSLPYATAQICPTGSGSVA